MTDDELHRRTQVSLPSDRFHTSDQTLTRPDWERRQAISYPEPEPEREDEE